MIIVRANARNATYISDDLITSGSVGIPVTFNLSEDFDGLSAIAVFDGGGVRRDVALMGTTCVVPHEVLATAGGYLRIGIYASNSAGTIVIPTVWAGSKMILQGAEPSEVDPSEPTPSWVAQVQEAAAEALEKAQNVEDMSVEAETLPPGSPLNVKKTIDPETGAVTLTFYIAPGRDGISPTIAVTEITGGHRVTITDAQGTRFFDVLNGTNGRGIASAAMNADYTLTLTYTDGTSYTTSSLRGAPGIGVPAGGAAGQVLKKVSGTDYDTEWGNEPIGATSAEIKSGTNVSNFITPSLQDVAAFFGLAKAAGSDEKNSALQVGQYTEAAKVAIQKMLGIYEAPWELIREDTFTNETQGAYTIISDANGQSFELTDICMMVDIPSQENNAAVGSGGRIKCFYSDTSADSVYIGTITLNAGEVNGRGGKIQITQRDGLIERNYSSNGTSGANLAIQFNNPFIMGDSSLWQLGQKVYTKIEISSVLGTCHYILLGKRKWN